MWKDFFYFTKTERQGIIVLVVLVIGVYTIPALLQAFSRSEKTDPTEQAKSEKEYNEFISSIKEAKQDKKYPVCRGKYSSPAYPKKEIRPAAFDPNTADSATFLSLGLPPWMAGNILRYRRKQGQIPTSGRLSENIRADGRTIPDSSTVYTHCRNTGPSRYQPDISSTSDCPI